MGGQVERVLSWLGSIPGVAGSLVADSEGRVLVRAFPPHYSSALLEDAGRAFADSAIGLEPAIGSVEMADFRFGEVRLLARTMPGAMLLVLCTDVVNQQLLHISISVAVRKLTQMVLGRTVALDALAAPEKAPVAGSVSRADLRGRGRADVLAAGSGRQWRDPLAQQLPVKP